ncbi:ferric reductase like transmembrane component-domain-containing protein [Mycena latifolia]|nr:ferric reductase like transmembrane component-domain-containing protein [Mycena latifolia]
MDFNTSDFSVDARAVNPDRAPSHARTYAYPPRVWYFIASFIALVSFYHFTKLLVSRMSSKKPAISTAGGRGRSSLRRIPLAILNNVRTVIFRTTLSLGGSYKLNVTELFIACAYIATLFTWALINTTNLEGVMLSPQYYANRIGLIAATQFPLVIALGMKNNIITFLTGISFDKLNILHRIAARVLCVMLWIHGSGHFIENGRAGNLEDLQETWFRCGIMAISALTLLCILSVQPLRSRAYELFLVAHFSFALIFLGGAYYHAANNGLGYYMWPSLMVWGFDRFLRFIRIFFVNGGYSTLFNTKSSHPLRAKIEVISPQFLRVTLRRPDYFRWSPGQLAYLAIPSVSAMPWEAHPFTIASIDGDIPRAVESQTPSRDESCEKETSVESVEAMAETLTPGYSKKLVFLLRVHDGFTKRLFNAANSSSTDETFGTYIDGPYCSPPSVRGFETVLLFCGGSGISFTLPLLLDLIRCARMGTNPTCRRVLFVWAIRHSEQIKAISDDLLRALHGVSDSLRVDIRIHVTAPVEDTEPGVEKSEGSITSNAKVLEAPGVQILPGRPQVPEIVKSEVAAASGSISVNVCGTAGLTENVRSALRAASSTSDILKGGPSINLHVEAFGM